MQKIKNILQLVQIIIVLLIPSIAIQYFFPNFFLFKFVAPLNHMMIAFFASFTNLVYTSSSWTILFVIVPWVVAIAVISLIINIIEHLNSKVDEAITSYKIKKSTNELRTQESLQKTELQKKQLTYVVIELVFAKFTISNFSDSEIEEKKAEVKADLLKDLYSYRGKLIENEEFDDPDTFAVLFLSQEDTINFVLKLIELINFMDNTTQAFGYSLGYKILLNVERPDAKQFYVLSFMEKALKAIELNEICTTNDFSKRYSEFGKMKNISFVSKGNYSINKARVELNRLNY